MVLSAPELESYNYSNADDLDSLFSTQAIEPGASKLRMTYKTNVKTKFYLVQRKTTFINASMYRADFDVCG